MNFIRIKNELINLDNVTRIVIKEYSWNFYEIYFYFPVDEGFFGGSDYIVFKTGQDNSLTIKEFRIIKKYLIDKLGKSCLEAVKK